MDYDWLKLDMWFSTANHNASFHIGVITLLWNVLMKGSRSQIGVSYPNSTGSSRVHKCESKQFYIPQIVDCEKE